ncbi:macrolide ABC transporter ATP-binding protein [Candidatus Curtissbacteria bacterium RIFCSPLOWO2_02_FULL_40_11]|uniref:Macrolide ABC transporter ATP-binding protein n=2 Tax=Candidatus Curtissiibacteriota TaxID=1752717 RepID=A0A1F5G8V0_9BACT|nr:MAG: macrolide ABC transporter ATP-binding protein [Candidatus Curtissbacteria bacterium RIFCSPHIGHO2_02_FULL_40_16b]OGE00057.1 MAG: macrolide ABC transporter ATP-binding protein [Candidatus Curtissbacteria bacterium RIFCSPLOWO2_02_FULL_40_11]OGE13335.1 MAG: macrolide ABC transporter ATP-binding protein [Candidatus Curtissbacteria bacterium RIFCSPLOWO2_12_FULL_38_9]
MAAIITAKNISKLYGEEPNLVKAVDDISLEIKKGEFVAIIGSSGSGKSTLMHILGCLDKPTRGQYKLEGRPVSQLSDNELADIRNKKIGFVFQFFNLLPRTSALKNVELPLLYAGVNKKERDSRSMKVLKELGLEKRLNSTSSQLSGGEQQRVAIARALINNPSVIFADEPTGNIDSKSSLEIMKIFQRLNKKGNTIILITHDKEVADFAKRIITIKDGKILADKIKK